MPTLDVAINALRAKHGAKEFEAATRKIKKAAKEADDGVKKVDKGIKKNAKSFKSLGQQMKSVVIGLVGVAAAYKGLRFAQVAIKDSAAFGMELANVSTMLDDQTMRYLPGYENQLASLATKYGQSTATLSKGLYDILSASIKAGDAIEVLEVASKSAIGGLTDTGTSADALTTVINAYGLEAKDAAKISDILFATVKRGKITFGELAGSIGKVVALAAAAGLSFEQMSAAVATMTRAGIQSDMAMTALKGIITTFLSPQKEGIEAAKKFGLELNTNTLQTIGLTGALEKLKKATAEESAAIFSNVRALLGAEATRKSLNALVQDYEGILKSTGMQENAYQKIANTTQHQLDRNRELFKQIRRDLGKGIKPALDMWMAGFRPFVEEWKTGWQAMVNHMEESVELIRLRLIPTDANRDFVRNMLAADEAIKKFKEDTLALSTGLERIDRMKIDVAPIDLDAVPDIRIIRQFTQEEKEAGKAVTALFAELKAEKDLIGLTTEERERAIKVMEFEAIAKKMGISDIKDLVLMYEKEVKSLQETEISTEYLDDQASAYRRLYEDLGQMGETSFDHKLMLLDKERKVYATFIKDKALLDEWYIGQKAQIDNEMMIASDNFFAGFGAGIDQMKLDLTTWGEVGASVAQTLKSATSEAVISMTSDWSSWGSALEGIGISVAKTAQKMIADMITMQIISAAIGSIGGLFGGGAGTTFANPMAVMGAPNAKGNIFNNGSIVPFAKGDILNRPTIFPMSNGGIGLGGEAGAEAIMPLGRDKSGRLGVRAEGDGGSKQPIKIINIMDQSEVNEYLNSADGEKTIVNIMRRNSSEISV